MDKQKAEKSRKERSYNIVWKNYLKVQNNSLLSREMNTVHILRVFKYLLFDLEKMIFLLKLLFLFDI